ncbi:MAG TPA: thioesterase family protein [Candidatus Binatia bacterium]|nr:thioesterase family protein [Candidatus Binatia bacterium]
MTTPTRDDFRFFFPLTPRWGDMDALGHVNNVRFFTYDESARLQYFQDLMKDDPKFWKEYGLILAHIEADFLQQLRLPAQLDIGFRIARIGTTSLRTLAAMFRGNDLVAVTQGVVVWFDYSTSRTLPVPEVVRQKIRQYEKTSPG